MVYRTKKSLEEALELLEKQTLELEEAKEMYRTLSRVSPVGIFRIDKDNKCVYVNEKFLSISGLKKIESVGDGWTNSIHVNDKEKFIEEWNHCFDNGKKFILEFRIKTPKGKIIWVLGQANQVNGGGKGYVGTVTDITDRKELLPQLLELKNDKKQRVCR